MLALLNVFRVHTAAVLSRFTILLEARRRFQQAPDNSLGFTPMYVMLFELDPFSELNARIVEWLWNEYGGGTWVLGRRRWKDLVACRTHPRLWLTADVPAGLVIHYFVLFGCRMTVSL